VNADIICSVPGGVQVCDLVGAGHSAGTAAVHSTLESTVGSVRSVMSVIEQQTFDNAHALILFAILWGSMGLAFLGMIVVPEVWRLIVAARQDK
jgi:hypothetical protein